MKNTTCMTGFLFLLWTSQAFSYDKGVMHPYINHRAAEQSGVASFLVDKLGLGDGLSKKFTGKTIIQLVRQGGTDEDAGLRALRHFHNPLKPWEDAGLVYSSSLVWAQTESPYQRNSWVSARKAYFQALTSGSEEFFADAFRQLGQVMHLLSDAAVPAHVRLDPHPDVDWLPKDIDPYEQWAKIHGTGFSGFYVYETGFDCADPSGSLAPVPISALWDQNKYNGSNPEVTLQEVGLAEYTNANFFSKDRRFESYPHPAKDDTNYADIDWQHPELVDAEDGKIDKRIYLYRKIDGENKYKLAAKKYFSLDTDDGTIKSYHYLWDDEVLSDYAEQLVPRAVGYSTALLDYFFRGRINMVSNPSGSGYVLENLGAEEMDGDFWLYYDDIDGDRHQVGSTPIWTGILAPHDLSTPDSANNKSDPIDISLPSSPAPSFPGEYMLVFRGLMGNEEGAVAAKLVQLAPQYIYFSTQENSFLWDVGQNDYAQLPDLINGGNIRFPISNDDPAWLEWFNRSSNVGHLLLQDTAGAVHTDATPAWPDHLLGSYHYGLLNWDSITLTRPGGDIWTSSRSHTLTPFVNGMNDETIDIFYERTIPVWTNDPIMTGWGSPQKASIKKQPGQFMINRSASLENGEMQTYMVSRFPGSVAVRSDNVFGGELSIPVSQKMSGTTHYFANPDDGYYFGNFFSEHDTKLSYIYSLDLLDGTSVEEHFKLHSSHLGEASKGDEGEWTIYGRTDRQESEGADGGHFLRGLYSGRIICWYHLLWYQRKEIVEYSYEEINKIDGLDFLVASERSYDEYDAGDRVTYIEAFAGQYDDTGAVDVFGMAPNDALSGAIQQLVEMGDSFFIKNFEIMEINR